jgi:hypothetical protein
LGAAPEVDDPVTAFRRVDHRVDDGDAVSVPPNRRRRQAPAPAPQETRFVLDGIWEASEGALLGFDTAFPAMLKTPS